MLTLRRYGVTDAGGGIGAVRGRAPHGTEFDGFVAPGRLGQLSPPPRRAKNARIIDESITAEWRRRSYLRRSRRSRRTREIAGDTTICATRFYDKYRCNRRLELAILIRTAIGDVPGRRRHRKQCPTAHSASGSNRRRRWQKCHQRPRAAWHRIR